jgi:putative spermidine/putrescine transport system substrate-binding protein
VLRTLTLVCAALLAIFALGACGDSESSGDKPAASGSSSPTETAAKPDEPKDPLTIAGWGGAYTKATTNNFVKGWEASGGVGAKFLDAPGTMVAKTKAQIKAGKVEFDVYDGLVAGDTAILASEGLLAKLSPERRTKLEAALGEGKVTDYGYTMGNTSYTIICNKKKVGTCPKDMVEFFDVDRFPQNRALPGIDPFGMVTMAAIGAGAPVADTGTSPVDLDQAFGALDKIKSKVKVFWQSGDQSQEIMRSGEVDLAIVYNARGYRLRDQKMDIDITWAGGIYNPAYLVVPKDSDQVETAFDYMEWIATNAEAQAGFSKEIGYSVPSEEALATLPEDVRAELPDTKVNFDQLAQPNWDWFVENADEVNKRWEGYARG